MPLLDAITVVDDNDNGAVKTDAWEDPDYGADNLCKHHNARSEKAVENVEVEYVDANDRIENIGLADNDEAAVIEKIVTNT